MSRMIEPHDVAPKPAYMVALLSVYDPAMKEYGRRVVPILEQFGEEVLDISAPSAEVVEGPRTRWPRKVQFHAFIASEAYRPLKAVRQQAATSSIVLFEGLR